MFSTAGARLYLGNEMDGGMRDAADFSWITTWTEVGGLTNLGRSGLRAEIDRVSMPNCNSPDGPDIVRKDVVSLDGGTMTVLTDLSHTDAGQNLAWASVGGLARAVRLVLPPSPPSPTQIRLFVAIVAAVDEQWDEANAVMKLMIELELDSNVSRSTL